MRITATAMRAAAGLLGIAVLSGCAGAASPAGSSGSASTGSVPAANASASIRPSSVGASVAPPSASLVIVSPIPSAPSSGKVVNLTARHIQWSVKTIWAPAGKTWQLHLDNQDKIEAGFHKHNFVIATGKSFAERSFSSPNVGFGTYTFEVPGLPAGTYSFMCTVHPDTMTGSLTLE
jgi:hypothetical protein